MPTVYAGQTLTAALLGVPDWTAMTLLNSWSNAGGSEVTAQYRYWQLTKEVEVIGNIAHASVSGNSQIASLPYTPASTLREALSTWNATSAWPSAVNMPQLQLTTAGALNLLYLVSGTTSVTFRARFPVDA